jgi:hypothetical protein
MIREPEDLPEVRVTRFSVMGGPFPVEEKEDEVNQGAILRAFALRIFCFKGLRQTNGMGRIS